MLSIAALGGALGSSACAHDSSGPKSTAYFKGDFLLLEQLASTPLSLVCDDTGRVTIAQSGSQITATGYESGVCRSGSSSSPVSGTIGPSDGSVSGTKVTLTDGGCTYDGTIDVTDTTASGTVNCQLVLSSGTVSAPGTWNMHRADFTPPMATLTLGAGPVSWGDVLHVTVQGTDNVALGYLGDSVVFYRANLPYNPCPTDPPASRDSVAVSGPTAQRTFDISVPACTGGITVYVFARDTAGNRAVSNGQNAPLVFPESQVSGSIDDSLYTLGGTVHIQVTASNSRGLGYAGYRWLNPNLAGSDSVAVTGTTATQTFLLQIPLSAPATQLTIQLFARHRLGYLTTVQLPYARTTDAVRYAVARFTLPSPPTDMVYAAGSDRIFVTDHTAAVREVLLNPLSTGAVYALAGAGSSLDLSPSEDSLLVALAGQLNVAVVRRGGQPGATVAITPPDQIDIYDARRMRVVAGGRAMIGVGSGSAGSVVQLDLSTAAQSVRESWYGYGTFERTGDRSRLLFVDNTSPVGSQLYLAGSDTFLSHQSGIITVGGETSGDDAATRWLAGCQLLTADMTSLGIFTDPGVSFGPSALATDASAAYCGRQDGFVQFDPATMSRVRAVWLPEAPQFLKALPGGRVLAVSGSNVYLVTVP